MGEGSAPPSSGPFSSTSGRSGGDLAWLNGRTSARSFYQHLGFTQRGGEWDDPESGPAHDDGPVSARRHVAAAIHACGPTVTHLLGPRSARPSSESAAPSCSELLRAAVFNFSIPVQGGALRAPRGAVPDAAASARAGRAACRPVPARRAAATTGNRNQTSDDITRSHVASPLTTLVI